MVEQLTQLGIRDGSVVLPNGTEHCGVRVSFVGDQIAQHLKHARDPNRGATTGTPARVITVATSNNAFHHGLVALEGLHQAADW
jgi:hypothetical protein